MRIDPRSALLQGLLNELKIKSIEDPIRMRLPGHQLSGYAHRFPSLRRPSAVGEEAEQKTPLDLMKLDSSESSGRLYIPEPASPERHHNGYLRTAFEKALRCSELAAATRSRLEKRPAAIDRNIA